MVTVALITEDQAGALHGQQWAEASYCNPVIDGVGRWIISLEEMAGLGLDCELVDYEPVVVELDPNE